MVIQLAIQPPVGSACPHGVTVGGSACWEVGELPVGPGGGAAGDGSSRPTALAGVTIESE